MSKKNVFFIINKYSGTSYLGSLETMIIDRCGALGYGCTIEFTKSRGHATELASQASRSKFDLVVAVGGDGTVNEVAQGLINTGTPMGILPKGSGNGLARHLGLPMKLSQAISVIESDTIVDMDTISVNGKLSVNVSGIGFDGHIASLFGKDGKRGLAGYAQLVLKEFFTYKEFNAKVTADDRLIDSNSFIIAVANSSQFGNNAKVAPLASVCDGLIDLCFVRKIPLVRVPAFASKMFSGKLDTSAFAQMHKAKQISMTFPEPMSFHIDGEAQDPATSFDIRIQPGTLKMAVPANRKV